MDGGQPTGLGSGRLDDDAETDWPDEAQAARTEDWTRFRAKVDRAWRLRRASAGERQSSDLAGAEPPGYGATEYPEFSTERLLSGPAADLFGDYNGPLAPAGELPTPTSESHPSFPPVPAPVAAEETSSGLVRPYFRTRGRTRPSYDLAIEALVSTSERGRMLERVRVAEHRSICGLCLDTRSVAEVAAYLRMPLGVARVLIGDVVDQGLVMIHSTTSVVGDRPSIEFMERVLSGLRRI
ncbi:DUF742 domain-containing protein [Amycolatopsis endophytica]|uniref:DUF742 domain-containing protein n=1 Tax=Amycolatopsis endophytica TaxID=860233 RepID=A0A853B2X1_9PSEU|nr:DUF742 domain-containing protein [Amycolatopsis endophytica]NYI89192.1 hypothetical protein [Amycolatopsis endophytica]